MLKFNDVSYKYPHSARNAVSGLSFGVGAGELLLCTGRSGCGKSTITRLANGLCPHYMNGTMRGEVRVTGQSTADLTPAELSMLAGTMFQDPEKQFFAMNVRDEIGLALQWRGEDPEKTRAAVEESAQRLGLGKVLDQSIFGLSEGQKQKVGLAALLALRPGLLILDEPSANLDPESTAELANILVGLKNDGMAILVADHRLSWLRNAADRVMVMDDGRIAEEGGFGLLDDAGLRKRYGLRRATVPDPRSELPMLENADESTHGEGFFSCRDITFAYPKGREIFKEASFSFPSGEVIALTGDNGVGKTTLSRILTGLSKAKNGQVLVRGVPVKPRHLTRHVQVVLQNASHQLRMNTVEGELRDASGLKNKEDAAKLAAETLELYGLAHLAARHPQSLSGGEKQRLALACATIRKPRALILDEPTSGLDGENMLRIARNVEAARESGASVLVITHDLELMQTICKKQLRLGAPDKGESHAHGL